MSAPPYLACQHVAAVVEPPVHTGLAGLVNSLVRNGFEGTVWAGYRGALPAWAADGTARPSPACTVRFVELATDRPLAFFKPALLELLWRDHCPDADAIVFFDTDIVVNVEWAFYRAWVSRGVAICEDLPHHVVGADHPLRHAWRDLLDAFGLAAVRPEGRYFNSGFAGVPRDARDTFLPLWRQINERLDALGELGVQPHFDTVGRAPNASLPEALRTVLRHGSQWDQDGLNMAVMASEDPLSAMGSDAMGFTGAWSFAMAHAIGPHKPWNKPLRRMVWRGVSKADETWWRYADGPLPAAAPATVRRRRAAIRAAKGLSRVVGAPQG